MKGSEYLPLPHKSKGFVLKVPFGKLAWVTVSLPLLSFIFCVIWSILFHFERATYTHCEVSILFFIVVIFCVRSSELWCIYHCYQVANFLPSISSAIGGFSPQRHVWRIAIAIHAGPRLLVARMYYRYYQGILYQWIHFMAAIACWLNVIENVALIGLTFISSAENHGKCINQNSSITLPWY